MRTLQSVRRLACFTNQDACLVSAIWGQQDAEIISPGGIRTYARSKVSKTYGLLSSNIFSQTRHQSTYIDRLLTSTDWAHSAGPITKPNLNRHQGACSLPYTANTALPTSAHATKHMTTQAMTHPTATDTAAAAAAASRYLAKQFERVISVSELVKLMQHYGQGLQPQHIAAGMCSLERMLLQQQQQQQQPDAQQQLAAEARRVVALFGKWLSRHPSPWPTSMGLQYVRLCSHPKVYAQPALLVMTRLSESIVTLNPHRKRDLDLDLENSRVVIGTGKRDLLPVSEHSRRTSTNSPEKTALRTPLFSNPISQSLPTNCSPARLSTSSGRPTGEPQQPGHNPSSPIHSSPPAVATSRTVSSRESQQSQPKSPAADESRWPTSSQHATDSATAKQNMSRDHSRGSSPSSQQVEKDSLISALRGSPSVLPTNSVELRSRSNSGPSRHPRTYTAIEQRTGVAINSRALVELLGNLAVLSVPPATSLTWLTPICEELSHNANSFSNREIAHTAWALARLALPHTLLLDTMAERLLCKAAQAREALGVSHAAVVAWAFARLYRSDRKMLRLVELTIQRHDSSSVNPQDVCQLLWAFAASDHMCERSTLTTLDGAARASIKVQPMGSLLQMAWAFATLGHRDVKLQQPEKLQPLQPLQQWDQLPQQLSPQQQQEQLLLQQQQQEQPPQVLRTQQQVLHQHPQQQQSQHDFRDDHYRETKELGLVCKVGTKLAQPNANGAINDNFHPYIQATPIHSKSHSGANTALESLSHHTTNSHVPVAGYYTEGYITQLAAFLLTAMPHTSKSSADSVWLDLVSEKDLVTLLWATSQVAGLHSLAHQQLAQAGQRRLMNGRIEIDNDAQPGWN